MSEEKKVKKSRFGSSAARIELAESLKKIKAQKLYPYGYAKKVQKIYNESLQEGEKEISSDYPHQVANCSLYNERVVDILLKLARENKAAAQAIEAKDILEM